VVEESVVRFIRCIRSSEITWEDSNGAGKGISIDVANSSRPIRGDHHFHAPSLGYH